MFLRSLLTAILILGAIPASAQGYTLVAVDVSGSVPRMSVHQETCFSSMCGESFVSASQRALTMAVAGLSDPLCGAESYVLVGQWSNYFRVLSPWMPLSTQVGRAQSMEDTRALVFQTGGGTYHRQSFHEAIAHLDRISPTIGTIIFVTDDDNRSDGWILGQEGYGLAEAMGYRYVEIVVTARDTLESLTEQLYEVFSGIHNSPFLCLG
jgi:hypothetical protein